MCAAQLGARCTRTASLPRLTVIPLMLLPSMASNTNSRYSPSTPTHGYATMPSASASLTPAPFPMERASWIWTIRTLPPSPPPALGTATAANSRCCTLPLRWRARPAASSFLLPPMFINTRYFMPPAPRSTSTASSRTICATPILPSPCACPHTAISAMGKSPKRLTPA